MRDPINYKPKEVLKVLDANYHYDALTGVISRQSIESAYYKPKVVLKKVGSLRADGYITVELQINKKRKAFLAHRLAWLFIHRKWPDADIDHINHKRNNNAISNLREVDNTTNGRNRCANYDKASMFEDKQAAQGVNWAKDRNRWRATIRVDGHLKHLGQFIDYHEAVNARKNAEVLYGFHENHGG